jgi:malate dehydrogenase (oxaloacetate-decarboxylating)
MGVQKGRGLGRMTLKEEALSLHYQNRGKLGVYLKTPIDTKKDLSLAYSPGVAEPCKEIYEAPEKIYDYTMKGNLVGVISNGTAVLGLGNIGPGAALPVMEGKAALFKAFAGLDAFPLCIDETDVDRFVEIVTRLEPTFGGINLEDIAAPQCFEIEARLKKVMGIPVFHDDQHGTAIVTMAGLINSLKLIGKQPSEIKVIVNGAGAAGLSIVELMKRMGIEDIILCDTVGAIYEGRTVRMNAIKEQMALKTNKGKVQGTLEDVIARADVFIGVSAPGVLTQEMIRTMNTDPIIFAMANPIPEIMPEEAKSAGARVIGTGRSDFPNQVNNVLAFPGVFKGALDVLAREINEEMKLAAVYAIASLVTPESLSEDFVIPDPFDKRVVSHVARAVAQAAVKTGVARKPISEEILALS